MSSTSAHSEAFERMRAVSHRRRRLAAWLSALMVLAYFGFLALVGWAPSVLATRLTPGLTVGVLLGALIIVLAWLLTWVYVRWTNRVYDPVVQEQRDVVSGETP